MNTLVFMLEEPSAKAMVEAVVRPRLPTGWDTTYVVFEGKQDLERNLSRRLKGWLRPGARFVVMRDQDAADCHAVKATLVERVRESGRTALVRVACRELEAWVLGDLQALADAYDYAGDVMARNMMEADACEGIDAFLQKRQPRWQS